MVCKRGRFYYGRNQVALGADLPTALRRWAELRGERVADELKTFALAAAKYEREELPKRAPKTQSEYRRQLGTLTKVFGRVPLDNIGPGDVAEYLSLRPKIAGSREKALLSLVFNFARISRLTNAANPCAGVRSVRSKRDRYVTDEELRAVYSAADRPLRDFLDLCYLTGQRPSDVLKMTRQDVRDGALWVRQAKTRTKLRLAIAGPLERVLARLSTQTYPVQAMYLVLDERGQGMNLQAMRKRFWKACKEAKVTDFQIRDLRPKYGSDIGDAEKAQRGLGHTQRSTTDIYLRDRKGGLAEALSHGIADNIPGIADKR
jgi:integrase